MAKIKCPKCGEKFENAGTSGLCENCRRKSHTKSYLAIAILILIFGFIGVIILGNTVPNIDFYGYDEDFNVTAMVYAWCGTALFDIFVFAFHSICYLLDLIIDKNITNN